MSCTTALQEFMANTGANEVIVSDWETALPQAMGSSASFQSLSNVLTLCTTGHVKAFKALGKERVGEVANFMEDFIGTGVKKLWSTTLESCKGMLLTKQSFFTETFGNQVQFLPNPLELRPAFMRQCVHHELLVLQIKALELMSNLLNQGPDSRLLQKAFNMDSLRFYTLCFLDWDKETAAPSADTPLVSLTNDLEAGLRLVEEIVDSLAKVEFPDATAQEGTKRFLGQFVTTPYFGRASLSKAQREQFRKPIVTIWRPGM